MNLRFLNFKVDQRPLVSWIMIIVFVFAQCVGSITVPLTLGASAGISFYEVFLSGMSSMLSLGFVFGVILIFLTADAYQNKHGWNRNLILRTGTRREWLVVSVVYLAILVFFLILAILAAYFISSIFLLHPDTVFQNFWIDPENVRETIVDGTAWRGSPAGAVCLFSVFLFCRFLFIALVIFGINLSQKKFQFGFCFPLLLALLEWKLDDLVPALSQYSILPYAHTVLIGKMPGGIRMDRVPVWASFLYWLILLGTTFTWVYFAAMRKDFATFEDNQ